MKTTIKMKYLPVLLSVLWMVSACERKASNFTLWQLPLQTDYVGNSYVFLMESGKVAVMDGGLKEEAPYLRGFLAALGNEVEAWFISHPHHDHIGALNEILEDPGDIRINTIYHSELPEWYYHKYDNYYDSLTDIYYHNLHHSGIHVVNYTEPGAIIRIDQTKFKILSAVDTSITYNIYNNSSMAIKVWDNKKSMLFLGDLAEEGGDLLLKSPYRDDLDCDYVQMAHHGQKGVGKEFYRSFKFRACLWPTPLWLYDNDRGEGFNTGTYKTVEIRDLMDSLGIKEHYTQFEGLVKIN
jgi:beta-lactamase superfamily II metal-dependent hydrolase